MTGFIQSQLTGLEPNPIAIFYNNTLRTWKLTIASLSFRWEVTSRLPLPPLFTFSILSFLELYSCFIKRTHQRGYHKMALSI